MPFVKSARTIASCWRYVVHCTTKSSGPELPESAKQISLTCTPSLAIMLAGPDKCSFLVYHLLAQTVQMPSFPVLHAALGNRKRRACKCRRELPPRQTCCGQPSQAPLPSCTRSCTALRATPSAPAAPPPPHLVCSFPNDRYGLPAAHSTGLSSLRLHSDALPAATAPQMCSDGSAVRVLAPNQLKPRVVFSEVDAAAGG